MTRRGAAESGVPTRSRSRFSLLFHEIGQPSYPRNLNGNEVAGRQAEVVGGDDPRAGEENDAVWEPVLQAKPVNEIRKLALHGRERGRTIKDFLAASLNGHLNGHMVQGRHRLGESDHRAQGARIIVNLRLGQVERILSLD